MYKTITLISLAFLLLTAFVPLVKRTSAADTAKVMPFIFNKNSENGIPKKLNRLLQSSASGIRTIVIDAGHGGKDHGCKGATAKEKTLTLKIALKLGTYIEKDFPAINVIYTRETDKFIPLHERAQIANQNKADLFISIHCNAVPKLTAGGKAVSGTETYVMGLHTAEENLEVAKRENEVILLEDDYQANYDGFDPNSPEGHIMLSMAQNVHLSQSINFAAKIDNQFRYRAKRKSRGVRQAGFMVLRKTTMPSVLIEAGFLTNIYEEKFLNTAYGQDMIASAIFRAFKEYYKEVSPLAAEEFAAKGGNLTYMKAVKGLVYKVQLAAASKPIETETGDWVHIDEVEIAKEGDIYKYLTGSYSSYEDCVLAQKIIKTKGFKDAFVVAYKDGKKISLAAAKALTQ